MLLKVTLTRLQWFEPPTFGLGNDHSITEPCRPPITNWQQHFGIKAIKMNSSHFIFCFKQCIIGETPNTESIKLIKIIQNSDEKNSLPLPKNTRITEMKRNLF